MSTRDERKIGRFEVMALLQAARYYVLTGDLQKAKSFGLNRAIFYAWLKYYGPQSSKVSRSGRRFYIPGEETRGGGRSMVKVFGPGSEEVPVGPSGWFEMGGKEQRPEDFDRQIRAKVEAIAPWDEVWQKAVEYVKKFPTTVLRDPQKFFEYVYKPVRDHFVERVLKRETTQKVTLLDLLQEQEEK